MAENDAEGKGKLKTIEKRLKKIPKEEVELIGDKTSKDKLAKALNIWVDLEDWRLSEKAMGYKNKMGGGKIKKNYAKGGGVRPTSY